MIRFLFTCAQVITRSLLAARSLVKRTKEPLSWRRIEHGERPTLSNAQTPIRPTDE